MEPRFGQDFSHVRVHSDRAAAEAAAVLNARAFTVGDHIFFGAGQSAAGGAGQRLMAHELTHVTQQRAGAVSGVPGPGGLKVSNPGDAFEAAAEQKAAVVVSAPPRATSTPLARAAGMARARGGSPAIQRFLAGERGHEGVEETALQEAGYSKQEAEEAYFGNWLRDFSQMMDKDSPTDPDTLDMIRLLSVGEFNRNPTNEDLGRYLPSEHLDNPLGGKTAEDADPHMSQAEGAQREKSRGNLNAEQQAWVTKERSDEQKIKAASEKSGLPEYLERGKAHAKAEIARAAQLGRTPEGLRALGNGLHAVEDYFAHSNFVEVALDQLGPAGRTAADKPGETHEGLIAANNPALEATKHYAGVDPTHIVGPDGKTVDNLGRPRIVTGTSAKGSGDTVGMWEAIKTEIATHEFLKAVIRSAVRRPWAAFRTLGKQMLGRVPGAVAGAALGLPGLIVGGAIGGAAGLVGGAAKGAAEGWRSGRHWWSKPLTALKGLGVGAAKGLVSGGKYGGGLGWKLGSGAGRKGVGAIGGLLARVPILREVVGAASAVAVALLGAVVEFAPVLSTGLKALARHEIKEKTKDTIKENPGKLPTHSQIAKDDPDQPLHNAAARLAGFADRDIGKTMTEVWAGKLPVEEAQKLVDVYVAHPQAGSWWKPVLLDAVRPKPPHQKSDPSLRVRWFWEMRGN